MSNELEDIEDDEACDECGDVGELKGGLCELCRRELDASDDDSSWPDDESELEDSNDDHNST